MAVQDLYDEFFELPLTKKIAPDFQDEQGHLRLNGYHIATGSFVELLQKIVDRNTDFESLKKELTEFIEDRTDFYTWLRDRFDDQTCGYRFE